MSIEHTGSTTKWDEYRQSVLKVHEWLVRDVIHVWRESQRYPWTRGEDINSSWCDIALPLWVKERSTFPTLSSRTPTILVRPVT